MKLYGNYRVQNSAGPPWARWPALPPGGSYSLYCNSSFFVGQFNLASLVGLVGQFKLLAFIQAGGNKVSIKNTVYTSCLMVLKTKYIVSSVLVPGGFHLIIIPSETYFIFFNICTNVLSINLIDCIV